MELHDYRVNANARQGDALRAFLRAEAAGITLLRPDQPRSRWFGGTAPARSTVRATAVADAELRPGS
jgi:hypothetical protein